MSTDQDETPNINEIPNETVSGSKVEKIPTDTPKHSDPMIIRVLLYRC